MSSLKCRTCLETVGEFYSLRDPFGIRPALADLLSQMAQICTVDEDTERLPQHLCGNCSGKLRNAYAFVQQAQRVNEHLLRSLPLLADETGTTLASSAQRLEWLERDPLLNAGNDEIKVEDELCADVGHDCLYDAEETATAASDDVYSEQPKRPRLASQKSRKSQMPDGRHEQNLKKKKKEHLVISSENVVRAIRAIKEGTDTMRAVARLHNLPRSTLRRYLIKVSSEYDDISTITDEELQETIKRYGIEAKCVVNRVFSAEEEEALVDCAKKCSDHYSGLSMVEFKELAYQFAKKVQAKHPPNWNDNEMSGAQWFYRFMRRHQNLTLRTHEQRCLNRSESFSKENLQQFFHNLDTILTPKKRKASILIKSASKTPVNRDRPTRKAQKKPILDEDKDFCIICLEAMPLRLSRNNSIACVECKREVHLKCVNTTSNFICQDCDSK